MNTKALAWIHRTPWRWALSGLATGAVLGTGLGVWGILYGTGFASTPYFLVPFFMVLIGLVVAGFNWVAGTVSSAYLANTLQYLDDAAVASRIATLPLKYAAAGAAFGVLSGLTGYARAEYPWWVVAVAAVCCAAIGFAVGFVSRGALRRRLSPVGAPAVAHVSAAAALGGAAASTFPNLTFAPRAALENPLRMDLFDRGVLECYGGTARFTGRRQSLAIRDVADVRLVGQPRFAWTVGAVTFVLLAPFALLVNWLTGHAVAATLLEITALVLACVWIIARAKWARVSYYEEDGTAREAFFLDDSTFADAMWRGAGTMGRTQDLLAALAAIQRTGADAAGAPAMTAEQRSAA
jgi:hypothetical protein